MDLEPILAIILRLNIRRFTNVSDYNENVLSETEHKHRKEGLANFGGILKSKQGYIPSKSEFYKV